MSKQRREPSKKLRAINTLGSTGYFFVVTQWLFAFILYFGWINVYFLQAMMPNAPEQPAVPDVAPVQPAGDEALPLIAIIGIALFVAIMLGVTIYALIKIPKMIAGAGNKVATVVAQQATPLIIKARQLPQTQKTQLKVRGIMLVYSKVVMVLLPIVFAWSSQFITEQLLPVDTALLVSFIIAIPAVLFFGLQYLFGMIAKIKLKDLI